MTVKLRLPHAPYAQKRELGRRDELNRDVFLVLVLKSLVDLYVCKRGNGVRVWTRILSSTFKVLLQDGNLEIEYANQKLGQRIKDIGSAENVELRVFLIISVWNLMVISASSQL